MTTRAEESAPKLRVLRLLADIFRVYARHWRLLVPLAAAVLVPQALTEGLRIDVDTTDLDLSRVAIAGLSAIALVGTNLAGEALYAGLITALVVRWRYGGLERGIRQYLRELPVLRLIAADLVLAAGTAIGFVLLVVPGVMFVVYTLVTTVMIELEDCSIREGIRRSASLVRGSFWRVLGISAILIVGTEAVTNLLLLPFHGFANEAAVHIAAESVVEPFQGVGTVLVALMLLEMRGEPVAPGRPE